MEIVAGALPSLIPKLAELVAGEYGLQKGLKGEIKYLQSELETMKCVLEDISKVPADQLPNRDKIWARHVREMSFDIEDSIDTFMVRCKSGEQTKQHGFKKVVDWSLNLLMQPKIRRKIATEIRDIKSRVTEVHKRHRRYEVNLAVEKPVTVVDPRLIGLYTKMTELVGIDEARDELIKTMVEGNEMPMHQGKIVSIVGFGGLGKTTLAKAVYEKLSTKFDCRSFVSVSQTPDMKKILKDILYDLGKKINEESLDEMRLINKVRNILQEKRYFIVVDDIWNISVWNIIRCALPDNNCGYGIIVTTRISDVSETIGGSYKMKPLSLCDSKKLLYRRIFGKEDKQNNKDIDKCLGEEMLEVSNKILKKCAGVPLAVITMASLLASKGRNKMKWYEVCNSIGTGLEAGQEVDNMRKILSFSYYDIPSHLRTCLLYLSVFPEDHEIEKDRLIWMWIGEGFIQCRKQEDSVFELGESYFNELMNRSVIQPVYDRQYSGLIVGCRLHDMVLDLIRSISSEENFVTILNDVHGTSPTKRVRRLSIQSNKVDHAALGSIISMLQVRSAIVFQYNGTLALPSFRVLRVLNLDHPGFYPDCLNSLEHLFHLRYLGLRFHSIKALPKKIGDLRFLQTLDMRKYSVEVLPHARWQLGPSTLFQLRRLKCLHIKDWTNINGIQSLTSLEELSVTVSSQNIMEELGNLTELKVLNVTFVGWYDRWEKSVVECLCKLRKIKSLSIWFGVHDLNLDGWAIPQHLCRFDTQLNYAGGKLAKLPAWMDSSLLVDLSIISIRVKEIQREDLEILGRLPALRILHLEAVNAVRILGGFVFSAGSFPCLVHYKVRERFIGPVVFQQGAMPRLTKLEFIFPVRETKEIAGGFDLGLANLPLLQHVIIDFETEGASQEEVMEAKAALEHAAEIHPNHPTLDIYRAFV